MKLEYNTVRSNMTIPEYGRNVQKMVNYALTIKDKEERNKVAKAIIKVMGQLNPHLRDVEDFTHKLWAHLFIMSDFKLDVDSPYPKPTPETFQTKPEKLPYPKGRIRYGHYGRAIPEMIKKCVEYPEGDEKEALIKVIANMMKKSYLIWNRDTVNDELIAKQLNELSDGKLELKDLSCLQSTSDILKAHKPKRSSSHKSNNKGGRRNNQRRSRKKRY